MISTVATNARRIMSERGLKHKSVAARAGFTEKQFSAILTGRRVIRDTDVVALSNALNVEPNTLFAKAADDLDDWPA